MEIDFEIGHIHNFHTSMTLTLDQVIWNTIMYHSSTSTYTPNLVEIGKTFLQTDGHTLRAALLG